MAFKLLNNFVALSTLWEGLNCLVVAARKMGCDLNFGILEGTCEAIYKAVWAIG